MTALPRHREIVLVTIHVAEGRDDWERVSHVLMPLYWSIGRGASVVGIGNPERPKRQVGHDLSSLVALWLIQMCYDVQHSISKPPGPGRAMEKAPKTALFKVTDGDGSAELGL